MMLTRTTTMTCHSKLAPHTQLTNQLKIIKKFSVRIDNVVTKWEQPKSIKA